MMHQLSRTLRARIVECVVTAAIVGTGWYFLLRPAEKALAHQREVLSIQRTQIEEASVLTTSLHEVEAEAQRASSTLATLQAAQNVSAGSARLYEGLNRLATAHSVKMIRLDPSGLRQIGRVQNAQGQPSGTRGEVQEYRVTVQGSYQAVARFIHGCEHSLGLSSVTKFRVTPVPESLKGDVEATVETAHLRVLPPENGGAP